MSKKETSPTPAPQEQQEEKHSSPVSRRQFLTMTAASTLALPLLLEACSPPTVNNGEKGEFPSEGGRSTETTDGRKETPDSSDASVEPNREPGREPGKEPGKEPASEPVNDATEPVADDNEPSTDASEPGSEPTVDANDGGSEPVPEATPDKGGEIAFDPNNFKESRKKFPLGVQSGAMRATSALVWAFYDGISSAQLKVWKEGSAAGKVVMVVDKSIPRGKDGYTKVPLSGLSGGEWYSFAFFSGKERSVVGRFRTAFAPGVLAPLTIGATTCTKNSLAPFESLQMLAKEKIDCILHLGDMSYNDGSKNLGEYRKVWQKQLKAGGYKELLPRAGMYITWDDHEITNNFDPETIDKKQLAAGKDAFFETLAVERGPNDRLWNSYLWGKTAEIILLDCRSERKPSTRKSNDPIYIGKAQMKWVKERLKKSPAHFKILMNSVPMTNMPAIWLNGNDRWEGFKKQREELLNHITDNKIKGVWFLSGDFHVGFVSKLEEKGKWSQIREVAVGPGDSFPNPLGAILPKKQFDYHSSHTKVMTTLTFDPKSNEVQIRFVRDNGTILYDKILKSA